MSPRRRREKDRLCNTHIQCVFILENGDANVVLDSYWAKMDESRGIFRETLAVISLWFIWYSLLLLSQLSFHNWLVPCCFNGRFPNGGPGLLAGLWPSSTENKYRVSYIFPIWCHNFLMYFEMWTLKCQIMNHLKLWAELRYVHVFWWHLRKQSP